MKYVKAQELLPEELLRELQGYMQGVPGYLYIPAPAGSRRAWGSQSGSRQALEVRNAQMRQAFAQGTGLDELAWRYHLAVETVRKIVYSK